MKVLPDVNSGTRGPCRQSPRTGDSSWEGSLTKADTAGRDTFHSFLFPLCCCLNYRCNGWCMAAILHPEVTLHTRMAGQKTDGAWLLTMSGNCRVTFLWTSFK